MSSDARTLLLAAPVGRTELPADEALDDIVNLGEGAFLDVVARHPASSLGWALLAEGSLSAHTTQGDLSAYAFARTGYHRGLDSLRRAAQASAQSARRKPWFGSCPHGIGPLPRQPARRRASSPRW